MKYDRCDKCGDFVDVDNHTCYPFEIEESNGDKYTAYGRSFNNAVEVLAKKRNESDTVVNENVFDGPLKVTDLHGVTKLMNCYAEATIDYYVSEVDDDYKDYNDYNRQN